MGGDITIALSPARMHRSLQLAAEQVNLGVGKVRQAAGVIEVEVRRDDVADVGGVEAPFADLGYGRLGGFNARANDGPERLAELARVARVVEAEAGVDEHQPFSSLDEEAVTDKPCAGQPAALTGEQTRPARAHRAAVQVVNRARCRIQRPQPYLHPPASAISSGSARKTVSAKRRNERTRLRNPAGGA